MTKAKVNLDDPELNLTDNDKKLIRISMVFMDVVKRNHKGLWAIGVDHTTNRITVDIKEEVSDCKETIIKNTIKMIKKERGV